MTFIFNEHAGCHRCPIRHRAVCARCDDVELTRLEALKSYVSYKAGDPIIWRGDELTQISSIVQGIGSLSRTLEDGRKQMVGLLLPSDFIGRPGRKFVDFDVTAVTDVTLCRFARKPFEDLVGDTPNLSQRVMEMALDELDAAREWMVLLGRKTAREKVATFIEMIVRRETVPHRGQNTYTLPLTREEIANFLGMTLETVSRQLSQMKKENVVSFQDRRSFAVLDLQALHAATGDDVDDPQSF